MSEMDMDEIRASLRRAADMMEGDKPGIYSGDAGDEDQGMYSGVEAGEARPYSERVNVTDPFTGRDWVHRTGDCPRCGERDTVLFQHLRKRTWLCGDCLPKERRSLQL